MSDEPMEEVFDISRNGRTKEIIAEFERCLTDVETAQQEMKEITMTCASEQFSKADVAAMKKVARLRMKDKVAEARRELAALERVSNAAEMSLFDFDGELLR